MQAIFHSNSLSWWSIWILEPDPWPCFYRMSCLSNEFSLATCNVTFHQKRASNLDGLFLTPGSGTSSARNENLRPPLNINIPLISGKYGLRNHFWSLESRFLMRKNEKKSIFSKPPQCPILSFWILNLHIIICQFKKKSTMIHFFLSQSMFLPLVRLNNLHTKNAQNTTKMAQ